jgi:quercetin dioxygenase-like cupin family protein
VQPVTSIEQLEWKPFSVEHSKGYEFMFNLIGSEYTDAFSVDLVRVAPGGYSPVHIDPDNHAFYFSEGAGKVTIAGKPHPVGPGSVVKIPFGALHSIENTGSEYLVFLTVYDPPRKRG